MTWWAILYLVLFVVLAFGGLCDDYRDQRPAWFLVAALLSDCAVIYLFAAYWHPVLRTPLGLVAPLAFVAAFCWQVYQAVEDFRVLRTDPDLSVRQQRVVTIIFTIVLPVICMPAFVVAGISAFRT